MVSPTNSWTKKRKVATRSLEVLVSGGKVSGSESRSLGGRCNFQVNQLRGRGAWEREIARSGTE